MNIQPKTYLNNIKLRKKAFGNERRRNMNKMILEHNTPFPLTVEFSDIDKTFEDWVNSFNTSFEGKKLPIFKLFSNQRIGEYAQSWQHLDELGNLLLNFFTITRENNVEQGQNQGGMFNIPGNRNYPICIKKEQYENGEERFEMYSMKQPYCADLTYTLTLITDKYPLLNEVNQMILDAFKSMECYIAPNGHYMPMTLEQISDESEYAIDDRKYYSQTYSINIMAYIIRKQDLIVTELPSRLVDRMLGKETAFKTKNKTKVTMVEDYECECDSPCNIKGEDEEKYKNKQINLKILFPTCDYKTEFDIDTSFYIDKVKTTNIYDFIIKINNEEVNFENEVNIYKGDTISIEITRHKIFNEASMEIIGYSDEMVDISEEHNESILDEEPSQEDIIQKFDNFNKNT